MLVVRIDLHNANTGEVSEIGRMIIANDGTGSNSFGNYVVKVAKPGQDLNASIWMKPAAEGLVRSHPRQNSVWDLVRNAINSLPEKP